MYRRFATSSRDSLTRSLDAFNSSNLKNVCICMRHSSLVLWIWYMNIVSECVFDARQHNAQIVYTRLVPHSLVPVKLTKSLTSERQKLLQHRGGGGSSSPTPALVPQLSQLFRLTRVQKFSLKTSNQQAPQMRMYSISVSHCESALACVYLNIFPTTAHGSSSSARCTWLTWGGPRVSWRLSSRASQTHRARKLFRCASNAPACKRALASKSFDGSSAQRTQVTFRHTRTRHQHTTHTSGVVPAAPRQQPRKQHADPQTQHSKCHWEWHFLMAVTWRRAKTYKRGRR